MDFKRVCDINEWKERREREKLHDYALNLTDGEWEEVPEQNCICTVAHRHFFVWILSEDAWKNL